MEKNTPAHHDVLRIAPMGCRSTMNLHGALARMHNILDYYFPDFNPGLSPPLKAPAGPQPQSSFWDREAKSRYAKRLLQEILDWDGQTWAWALVEGRALPTHSCPFLGWLKHSQDVIIPQSVIQFWRHYAHGNPPRHPVRVWLNAPISRWLGFGRFCGRRFYLNDATLDPRWETQGLLPLVQKHFEHLGQSPRRILELGTGSGCLLVSVLLAYPEALGVGGDISKHALAAARYNGKIHGVNPRCLWRRGSWYGALTEYSRPLFDVLVCNPPYISHQDCPSSRGGDEPASDGCAPSWICPQTRAWDPPLALYGGADGMEPYRILAKKAHCFVRTGGLIALEMGCHQGPDIVEIFQSQGLGRAEIVLDANSLPRYVTIKV